ncbi:unnamed protein product, partial [Musa hybrid cultivar]
PLARLSFAQLFFPSHTLVCCHHRPSSRRCSWILLGFLHFISIRSYYDKQRCKWIFLALN